MSRCRESQRPSPSADGQTDGDLLRDLAQQTNEALKALLKRIEALESRAPTTDKPAVVINVGSGTGVYVSQEDEPARMGFKSK